MLFTFSHNKTVVNVILQTVNIRDVTVKKKNMVHFQKQSSKKMVRVRLNLKVTAVK